jgi:hypothetical protein
VSPCGGAWQRTATSDRDSGLEVAVSKIAFHAARLALDLLETGVRINATVFRGDAAVPDARMP